MENEEVGSFAGKMFKTMKQQTRSEVICPVQSSGFDVDLGTVALGGRELFTMCLHTPLVRRMDQKLVHARTVVWHL